MRAYLAIAAWGAPAGLAFRLFASYTTAVSLPRVMMTLNLLGLAVKVPLNWVFIFGHLGAPAIGRGGLRAVDHARELAHLHPGLALVRIAGLSAAIVSSRAGHGRAWRDQRRLLALGMPIGLTFLVDVTAFTFMALFIARLGAVNSAAHQIAANVAAVMYMLPLAMGNAVGVLVGQAIGASEFARGPVDGNHRHRACVRARRGLSATTLALGRPSWRRSTPTDADVQAVAATLLVFVAVYHVFDALQAVTVSALRGYKRAVVPLLSSMRSGCGAWDSRAAT